MSTRAVIARAANGRPLQFAGNYHHWDGYPAGLGKALYDLYNGFFNRDASAMLHMLIDEHASGWSTIVDKDFQLEPGFNERGNTDADPNRPQCYCHGDRQEEPWEPLTQKTASSSGCEYAYVFEGATMHILASYCGSGTGDLAGNKMIGAFGSGDPTATWKAIGTVDLDGTPPEWALFR